MSLLNKNMSVYITFLLVILFISCKKEKIRICEVYTGPNGYSIGTITDFVSVPTKVTYSYEYNVDGINYTGKEKAYGIGQENSRLVGKSFVVVYKADSPDESDLNTDYRVESLGEFQQYEDEFENNPPEPDWPNCK